ncbi:hypothetical protein P3T76_014235 [Phytophthora citrophthora]|uniref:Ubiquitin-like protease family profile domain-containing protein n=1 Tax=Phytophthora citrophthora TaxID=4793 RepID=A0AAD9LBD6_9STRA|nr:hypothetical protein P3T76_014235 [Phytophthora citrophthora]
MGGFHGARTGFGMIEDCLEWIRDIDVEGTQLGSIFGDVGVVTIEDISTCVGNINTCGGKEKSLLDLLHNEAEDIAMTAAISAMCADANSVAESAHSTTFTTQLMGLGTDEERLEWLKEHTVISSSGDKIVGALWLRKDHWCGIGISLKTYVFKIMDLRNNEATIDAIERIFRRTFLPLLPQEKRWRREISRFFQQLDGESCGVLVLAFIESYLFESLDIPSDTKLLRFHYMLKILLSGE